MVVAPEFADFYAATFPQLLTQLHAFVGDRAEAQDLVQEAYTRAFARWSAISQFEDPVGWVRRVAWNLAVSRWRRARRLLHLRRDLAPADVEGPDGLSLDLTRALAKLPPVYRQAVVRQLIVLSSSTERFLTKESPTVPAPAIKVPGNPCGEGYVALQTTKPIPSSVSNSVQDQGRYLSFLQQHATAAFSHWTFPTTAEERGISGCGPPAPSSVGTITTPM